MSRARANAAEEMRWCSLGCGLETAVDSVVDGKCPRCGSHVMQSLGWRYRNSKGTYDYHSTFESLPPEVRRATTG